MSNPITERELDKAVATLEKSINALVEVVKAHGNDIKDFYVEKSAVLATMDAFRAKLDSIDVIVNGSNPKGLVTELALLQKSVKDLQGIIKDLQKSIKDIQDSVAADSPQSVIRSLGFKQNKIGYAAIATAIASIIKSLFEG